MQHFFGKRSYQFNFFMCFTRIKNQVEYYGCAVSITWKIKTTIRWAHFAHTLQWDNCARNTELCWVRESLKTRIYTSLCTLMPRSSSVGQISVQIHDTIHFVLYCVEDMNRLSCLGSSVGRALTETRGSWVWIQLKTALLFPWKKSCPGCSCLVLVIDKCASLAEKLPGATHSMKSWGCHVSKTCDQKWYSIHT